MAQCVDLSGGWEFREANGSSARRGDAAWKNAVVPGCVHTDLMALGEIPDPFYDRNERDMQWVESRDWIYRKRFSLDAGTLAAAISWELVCQGLDTVADLRLNGEPLGKAANMFHEHRFPLGRRLRPGENELLVRFSSPESECARRYRAHGLNRDPARSLPWRLRRAYLRKAQYSFGWDWGPRLATSGIWRGIHLAGIGEAVVDALRVWTTPTRGGAASVAVDVEVRVARPGRFLVEIGLQRNGGGETIRLARSWPRGRHTARCALHLNRADLWWPRGYGEPALYDLVVVLRAQSGVVDTYAGRVGIREIQLERAAERRASRDPDAESFVFRVNGCRVFARGANWVPADSFLPRVGRERYRALVGRAADANMNMLRVWGGGVYEDDAFYEACDEMGILVWQDFMFACAPYPETREFLGLVRREAESVVRRLRNHPSIALWCGNDENDWGYHSWGWSALGRYHGRRIYHEILPQVCAALDPARAYWPSSPYGGSDPNGETAGDRHNWAVWSAWQDYPAYRGDCGRFISEFGFQAPACERTWAETLPAHARHSQSPGFEHHEKQGDGIERIYRFLAARLPMPRDFAEFVYLAQVNQADAIQCGVDHWRRRKFDTAGALFWQHNDCWPVTSWSCVDSRNRPKALFYAARRFFADVRVAWIPDAEGKIEAWATADGRGRLDATVDLSWVSVDGRRRWSSRVDVRLSPDRARRIGRIPDEIAAAWDSRDHLAVAVLRVNGRRVARDIALAVPFKHLRLPATRLQLESTLLSDGRVKVRVGADVYAKAVELRGTNADAEWSDNFFDLLPGETRTVTVTPAPDTDPRSFSRALTARCVRPVPPPPGV